MPRKPVVSEDVWTKIKILSIRGTPDEVLCKKYGIKPGTLRKKRHDDIVWRAAVGRAKEFQEEESALVTQSKEVAAVLKQEIERIADENDIDIARFARSRIKSAINRRGGLKINDWSDMTAADKLIRKAAGKDKSMSAVQVNVGHAWSAASVNAAPECGVVVIEGQKS